MFVRTLVGLFILSGLAMSVWAKSPEAPKRKPFQAISHDFALKSDRRMVAGEVITHNNSAPSTAIIVIGGSKANKSADTKSAVPLFIGPDTAVVLFDRRGYGASTGVFDPPTTHNSQWQIPAIGSDVARIAEYLKAYGFKKVGAAGSSMGGWVAASAAAQSDDIDFIIGIVGGVVSVATSDAFDQATDEGLNIERALIKAQDESSAESYDPIIDLEAISQPGFWVFAENDRSNPSQLDIERLDALIASGQSFSYRLVKNADHNLTDVSTGEFIGEWIPDLHAFIITQVNH